MAATDPGKCIHASDLTHAVVMVLDLTVIRFAWTLNSFRSHFVLAGIIWILGWCMAAILEDLQ